MRAFPAAFSTLLSLPCHGLHHICEDALVLCWHGCIRQQSYLSSPTYANYNSSSMYVTEPVTGKRTKSDCLLESREHACMEPNSS